MKPRFSHPRMCANYRWFHGFVLALIGSSFFMAQCDVFAQSSNRSNKKAAGTVPKQVQPKSNKTVKVVKTDRQWRQQLTAIEYEVTRRKGTERSYSGKYWDHKEAGIYTCKCCGNPLFDSKTKFKSGTGWPSYYQPLNATAVKNIVDYSDGMVRTEVTCRRCDAHLGHVFKDGPRPTGLRYCMNSVALGFQKKSVVKQAKRSDAATPKKTGAQPKSSKN